MLRPVLATIMASVSRQVNDFTRPEDIAPVPIDHAYTTQFVFPYAVGRTFSGFDSVEKLNKVLSGKLRDLGITTLLFMKHLSVIEYEIRTDATPVKTICATGN